VNCFDGFRQRSSTTLEHDWRYDDGGSSALPSATGRKE
jgi:hypothetical protein